MDPNIYRDMGLNDDEYDKILKLMGRTPNYVEIGMFAVMWSEHCGYKNSRPLLKTLPTEAPWVIHGPGENAGVIDIGDGQALVFKIESHNHPSAIEPYQGAATGVGGIVRDIFTMGARPIAVLDSLRFGSISDAKVRQLFAGVVAGIAGYGNCLGIPTVGGEVYFDECYAANPLVNAMCVGLVNKDEIALAVANDIGAKIMIVGARTGRDGIHGATFASEELSERSEQKRPAVQVGDPFMEKLLIEACLELIQEGLVDGMQDLGAAGLTSSIAETATKKGRGVEVDVLLVPRRETGMSAYELMLSESQERMLIVPKAGMEDRISAVFDKWGLDAVVIGTVTGDGVFRVKEGDRVEAEIPVSFLTDECPVYTRQGVEPDYYEHLKSIKWQELPRPDLQAALLDLLASPDIASKKWVIEQYDHQVMTNSVVVPGDGDAAVVRIKGTAKAVALATDCNSRMVYLDPYRGAKLAVCEAARNVACSGARPLALTNCLNFGNPEKPEVYWQMQNAVRGIADAARALKTPVVSGNVSLYNESAGVAVYPTPVIGMAGLLDNVNDRLTLDFKDKDDLVVLLGGLDTRLGGSEYLRLCHGIVGGEVPDVDLLVEKSLLDCIEELACTGIARSCHDISDGGLAVALAESAIKGKIGCEIKLTAGAERPDAILFSEAASRVVVTVQAGKLKELEYSAGRWGVPSTVIGKVGGQTVSIDINGNDSCKIELALDEATEVWGRTIECLMS